MNDGSPAPVLVPQVFRFNDIDAFRSSIRNLNVEFTPLAQKISAEQIILNLPGCDLNFTKSFPRIIDGQLAPNCTAVGFSMDDGVPMRFNGVERDRSTIVIGRGGAAYSAVERTARQYSSIIFSPEVEDRGWPETDLNFKIFETSEAAQFALRELVHMVLSVSPQLAAASGLLGAAEAIKESLLSAIDNAFANVVDAKWTSRANSTRRLRCRRK